MFRNAGDWIVAGIWAKGLAQTGEFRYWLSRKSKHYLQLYL